MGATAFERFVSAQQSRLVKFLRGRTASLQDAEDAAQESLTRMLRYRDSAPASAWRRLLYRVAVNVAHDQFRKARTHRASEHVSLDRCQIATSGRSPEEQAVYEQQLACLRQAIRELPPKCQRVYLLKRMHGLSHAEVGAKCGISARTVEKHLAKASFLLRRKVGKRGPETSE